MHEVSRVEKPRFSSAFQLLAQSDTQLDPALEETAAAFVHRVSAMRISSNFARVGQIGNGPDSRT